MTASQTDGRATGQNVGLGTTQTLRFSDMTFIELTG